MKKLKQITVLFLAVIMAVTILPMQTQAASKVKLSKTGTTVYAGNTTTLKVSGTSKKVTWSTSNAKIATVTSKGKVTAKKKGTATITAKVSGRKYTCKVTVKIPYLNKTKVSIVKGKTYSLKLTGAKAKKWTSSNKKVATVSSKGKITAIGKGTATITCYTTNGRKLTSKCTVTTSSSTHTHSYKWVKTGNTRTQTCKTCGKKGITETNYKGLWGYYDDKAATKLFKYVNDQRARTEYTVRNDFGTLIGIETVPALKRTSELDKIAKNRALEVALDFSHEECTTSGENLAAGQGTPEAVNNAWQLSRDHLRTMVSHIYTTGGIACFWYDSDNSGNCSPIWVLSVNE